MMCKDARSIGRSVTHYKHFLSRPCHPLRQSKGMVISSKIRLT